MRRQAWIGAVLFALLAGGWASGGEPPRCEPGQPCLLEQQRPAAAWFPYGGGLLHWWDPHCFPRCAGPDDYCRKKLPKVCWPAYPPWYVWDRPGTCYPDCKAH